MVQCFFAAKFGKKLINRKNKRVFMTPVGNYFPVFIVNITSRYFNCIVYELIIFLEKLMK